MGMIHKTTLGIDYGRQRVGLAIGRHGLAEPLEILLGDLDFVDRLQEIISQQQVEQLVVGISENQMAKESRAFGQNLERELGLPVHFTDETLSSQEARAKLRQTRVGKRQYKGPIDHFAAAVFLQDWLDSEPDI